MIGGIRETDLSEASEFQTLYLRWRPRTFNELVGQDHITRTLRNAIKSDKLAHAYLFCGPRGTGKTSLARILYKAANCLSLREGEPCGECHSCQAADGGRALDLVEIDAASNRSIDDIRQLRERVAFAPNESRFRFYILDEAHELTPQAWDAFLKTLEEPPPHTRFVLATTQAHKVPATIASRCQRFDFRRIPLDVMRGHLVDIAAKEGIDAEPATLDRVARIARGGMRDAIGLLDQLRTYGDGRVTDQAVQFVLRLASEEAAREFLDALREGEVVAGLLLLDKIAAEGADVKEFLRESLDLARAILLASLGAAESLSNQYPADVAKWASANTRGWERKRLMQLIRSGSEIIELVRDPDRVQVHVELLTLDLCQAAEAVDSSAEVIEPVAPVRSSAKAAPDSLQPGGVVQPLEGVAAEPLPSVHAAARSVLLEPPQERAKPPSQAEWTSDAERLALLRQNWPLIVERVRDRVGVVAAVLEAAHVASVASDVICVAFDHRWHHQQFEPPRYRSVLEAVATELLGETVRVRSELVAAGVSHDNLEDEITRLRQEDPVARRAFELGWRGFSLAD